MLPLWLGTIELDLQQHNLGSNTAWKLTQDPSMWSQLVETLCPTKDAPIDEANSDEPGGLVKS